MKYTIQGLDKSIKLVEDKSTEALKKCGLYLEKKLKEAVYRDSYDTGKLAESINTQQINKGKVIVGTNLIYGIVREEGRRPGKFPPLDALVGWTARKGIINSGVTKRYDDLSGEDKGKVFIIARAIARRGIEGKHTFKRTIEAEQKNIINLYAKLMDKGL